MVVERGSFSLFLFSLLCQWGKGREKEHEI